MSEKHTNSEKYPRLKWFAEKAKVLSNRAFYLGFSAAAIGVLIAVGGYVAGTAGVIYVGGLLFNKGLLLGIAGGIGKIIGDPDPSYAH